MKIKQLLTERISSVTVDDFVDDFTLKLTTELDKRLTIVEQTHSSGHNSLERDDLFIEYYAHLNIKNVEVGISLSFDIKDETIILDRATCRFYAKKDYCLPEGIHYDFNDRNRANAYGIITVLVLDSIKTGIVRLTNEITWLYRDYHEAALDKVPTVEVMKELVDKRQELQALLK